LVTGPCEAIQKWGGEQNDFSPPKLLVKRERERERERERALLSNFKVTISEEGVCEP
jgi:hypothetical protein